MLSDLDLRPALTPPEPLPTPPKTLPTPPNPTTSGTLVVNPLVPAATLPWWAADGVALHGKIVTVVFDADGTHYKHGAGLKGMVNGATAASSPMLTRLTVQL